MSHNVPYIMEINHVWNHQPDNCWVLSICPSCDCNTRQDLGMYHWRWSIQHTLTVWELHLLFNNLKSQVMGMLLKVSPVLAAPLVVESATTQRVEQCTQWEPGLQCNVGKTIMNHPFGHGFIEPIYGDLVDDLLLFYQPYTLLIYWSLFATLVFHFMVQESKLIAMTGNAIIMLVAVWPASFEKHRSVSKLGYRTIPRNRMEPWPHKHTRDYPTFSKYVERSCGKPGKLNNKS